VREGEKDEINCITKFVVEGDYNADRTNRHTSPTPGGCEGEMNRIVSENICTSKVVCCCASVASRPSDVTDYLFSASSPTMTNRTPFMHHRTCDSECPDCLHEQEQSKQ